MSIKEFNSFCRVVLILANIRYFVKCLEQNYNLIMKNVDKKIKPLEFKRLDKILIGIFLSSLVLIILPYDVCLGASAEFISRFLKASLLSIFSFILIIRFWNKKLHSKLKFRKGIRFLGVIIFVFIALFNLRALFLALLIYPHSQYVFYDNVANSYDKIIYRYYRHFPMSGGDWKLKRVYCHDYFPLISIEQDYKSEDVNGIWKGYGYPNEDGKYKRTVRFLNGEVVEILDSVKVQIKE
ncbi:hypothetical protein [Bernardetia sp. MNP-M8]|uniref:hypothetical protein n=1 Tax=Bernardetia sp. MNP-M8 TaxID=3127470 RepID=UPI0030CE53E6